MAPHRLLRTCVIATCSLKATLLLLVLSTSPAEAIRSLSAISDLERQSAFIGYSEKNQAAWDVLEHDFLKTGELENRTEPILLSKSPCVLLLPNYITPDHAKELVRQAEPRLRSQQFHNQPDTRTSWGMVMGYRDSLAGDTIRRSEQLVQASRSDGLEVKRYRVGEKYNSHHDYFSSPQSPMKDDRVATFLIYLNSAEEGGETIFPWAKGTEKIDPRTGWPLRPLNYNTECEPGTTPEGAVKVKVPTGYAVLFYNTLPNGDVDPYSQHGSCPVKKGEKWTATVWTRGTNRFDPNDHWKTSEILKQCYNP